ncbi:aminotransferase class III-fold pyridoxal phosphate-dependent enzyme [Pseudoalteromonas sp. HM-SA03]|uniref:aminotransferase class III-fold pyridoxal phosphate-dependent enzyme n=1 Tax=Pseudoalteromonas sp. HM-SA03 TaxID=2029678 RepID=UPI001C3F0ABE|nr:aminotransferase class III-fold pyridoxal phosphate-dependent enzyme [Pseudoalteromonas sp. HM-SA03]
MKLDKCNKMLGKAKQLIPGGTQLLSKRPDMFSPDAWPTYYQKATGATIWDLDGNEYIDMSIAGIGANVLGYATEEVNQAVIDAINNGVSSSLNCPEEVELAELLTQLHPWAEQVKYTRSGGEAMSVAVRIARAATGKEKIAFCGYHGWSDWYIAANVSSDKALNDHLIPGLAPKGVPKSLAGTSIPFGYNNIEELEKIMARHGHEMAGVVMEPFRNYMPDEDYWPKVEQLCKDYSVPLIIDEISMGFRLNCGGAHLKLGITPDIAVFSKALGNGHAIAAIIGKKKWMEHSQDSFISSTMWTERVGPAAALATIRTFEQNQVEKHLAHMGEQVMSGWQELANKHGLKISIGGIPALAHFGLQYDNFMTLKSYFVQLMLKQGYLASNLYYAMYAHTQTHIDGYLSAVDNAFEKLKKAIDSGLFETQVTPATSGFKRLN